MEMTEMSALVDRWKNFRKEKKAKEEEVDQIEEKIRELEIKIIQALEAVEETKYPGVSLVEELSVKTPQTDEDKQKFFTFLKSRNEFDAIISVNSRTLQAYYKSLAEEKTGSRLGLIEIPGIETPTIYKKLKETKT